MSALVDIIIPTYNRRELLGRAIQSVLAQSLAEWQLWVVDDGSTDGTLEWLEREFGGHPQIKTLTGPNEGVSAARNKAIKLSQAPWVAFLDSDDEWLPHKLEAQLTAAKQSSLPLIHGEEIWIRKGRRVNPKKKHQKFGGRVFKHCLPLCCISPSASLLSRELFNELGLFREDYPACEDYDLWLRISARHEVHFIEKPLIVKYGGHEDQLSNQYKAMDYWRVKSMMEHLDSPWITPEERELLKETVQEKSKILIKGYEKHQNQKNSKEINHYLHQVSRS